MPSTSMTVVNMIYPRPSEQHFAYLLYTVNTWRLTGETLVWAPSAQAAVADAIARGYAKAEAAPASRANGCGDKYPTVAGDTASVDTRK